MYHDLPANPAGPDQDLPRRARALASGAGAHLRPASLAEARGEAPVRHGPAGAPLFHALDPAPMGRTPPAGGNGADGGAGGPPLLEHYWQLARQNWSAIALIVLAALVVGVMSVFFAMRLYTAQTRIEIDRPADMVTRVQGVQADQYQQHLEYYETQYSLLEAQSLAQRVVRALGLAQDERFFALFQVEPEEEFARIAEPSREGRSLASFRRDLAAQLLLENLRIRPVKDSSLVDVLVTSPLPQLSARIANTWVDQFIEAELERRSASSVRAREYLEGQLVELRQRLEESERQLVGYASARGIVALGQQTAADGTTRAERTMATASLEALNQALAQATASRMAAEADYRAGASSGSGSAENQALAQLRQARAMALAEQAQLLAKFGPEYPAIEALALRIASLEEAIMAETRSRSNFARADFLAAQAEEQSLQRQVAALTSVAIGERGDSIQYGIYQREVDTNRQLYEALLQRYKELGVADIARSNVAVIDRAEAPDFPSSPRVPINLGLALLAGLALAGGYILARVNLDHTIRNPAQVPELLGGPLLGSIPHAGDAELLDEIRDRHSHLYEAYLSVRTNLEFLTSQGAPGAILLTSTMPNEGKSNSAIAIARILADTGRKVLLVDADLRKPSLRVLESSDCPRGLSNYLSGTASLDALIVSPDGWEFDLLPAGPLPPNIGGLLMNRRLDTLLEEARERYDHVVIDGPPVLGLADAPALAACVEGLVFVIEANRTRINAVRNSLRRIAQANGHVFGFVITKLDGRNAAYGYGSGDAYGYSYGHKG